MVQQRSLLHRNSWSCHVDSNVVRPGKSLHFNKVLSLFPGRRQAPTDREVIVFDSKFAYEYRPAQFFIQTWPGTVPHESSRTKTVMNANSNLADLDVWLGNVWLGNL